MKNIRNTKNPFLLFSPFLIILLIIVFIFHNDIPGGDESRYLTFADNILNGFYSLPAPHLDLGNGPGYPLLLVPFVALHLPLVCIALMNAVFFYLSIVLIYKILIRFVSLRVSLIFSLFWACYIHVYEWMHVMYPEILTVFLISLITYNVVKAFNIENSFVTKKYLYLSGFLIGYLALVKPIFGYVLLVMLIGSGSLLIFNWKLLNYRKGMIILSIALTTTAPYLIYTYHLTGKIFYWSSFGGDNLYWMSTPFEGEYGDWFNFARIKSDSLPFRYKFLANDESLRSNHLKDYNEILKYNGVERDDAYKKIAVNNIKSHPFKFMQNCISNVGRMVFNFPNSYKNQTPNTLLRLPINGIIIVLILFCLYPTFLNWRMISYSIKFMLSFILLYFCGSILGSAEPRMFNIIIPVLLVWIALIIEKSISVKWKFE